MKKKLKNSKIAQNVDESNSKTLAQMTTSPEVNAAITHVALNNVGQYRESAPAMTDLMTHLQELGRSDESGEAALLAQATTLDKLFNHMIQIAFNPNAEHKTAEHWNLWLKFALRAQSQCRTTYEAISAIRHPRVQYVGEQYNANGHMQVNKDLACTPEKQNSHNELTQEVTDELCQNTGAPAGTGRTKSDSQALVEIKGADKRGRKAKVGA